MGASLNSREWAIVTLIVLIAAVVLVNSKVREQVLRLLRQLVNRAITLPLLALACWVVLWVAGAYRLGLWNWGLLKDTVVWYLASALGTMFAALKAAKTDGYFRHAAKQAVAAAVFLQCAMNLYTFNYFVELLLQAVFLLMSMMLIVAERDLKFRSVKHLIEGVYAIVVILVFVFTARGWARTWRELDARQVTLGLAFSVWLPLVVLPFIWAFALVMSYEIVLKRMREPVFGLNAPTRTRIALIAALGADLRAVNDLPSSQEDVRSISSAGTWREVREAVRVYGRRRERRRAEPALTAQRLARFAGVKGVDSEGRQRDQRGIAETKAALEWLATCHMGHHRGRGAYRSDLVDVLGDFDHQGLPHDHGIEMVVARGGASWYAWGRTPSGLVLGIGAASGPPDQWFYAAMEPPSGPPTRDPRWEQWTSEAPDWRAVTRSGPEG